jgi:hypothetical protein
MINYYFFQFIKKTDQTRSDRARPIPSRGGPTSGGQRWDGFNFFKFGPPSTDLCGPCGTVDRASLNRTGSDRPRPTRTVCKSLVTAT